MRSLMYYTTDGTCDPGQERAPKVNKNPRRAQFPYVALLAALRERNPGKAAQLELWWAERCIA